MSGIGSLQHLVHPYSQVLYLPEVISLVESGLGMVVILGLAKDWNRTGDNHHVLLA
jgi:hypothetical protein